MYLIFTEDGPRGKTHSHEEAVDWIRQTYGVEEPAKEMIRGGFHRFTVPGEEGFAHEIYVAILREAWAEGFSPDVTIKLPVFEPWADRS